MIRGMHAMFYSSHAEELRAFIRDKLGLPFTAVGGGWRIFDLREADVGVHPTEPGKGPPSGTHDVSFCCDDIDATRRGAPREGRRVQQPDHGRGLRARHVVHHAGRRGGSALQPKYAKARAAR